MKTIAITMSRGMLARNFLHNDFFSILREKYKIIVLTPAAADERFQKEFSHPNVTFMDLQEYPWSFWDGMLVKLHKMLMLSSSVRHFLRYGIPHMVKRSWFTPLKATLAVFFFWPFSKIGFLKECVRAIDFHYLQKDTVETFGQFLTEKDISFVFCSNLFSDTEVALTKAAQKNHIPVWGMPKSWDNLGNSAMRVKPDRLLVWNEFMKEQAIRWHHVDATTLDVIGILQFDLYLQKERLQTREEFCRDMGLDPNKKIIVFGSEGKNVTSDPDIAEILAQFVEGKNFIAPSQILLRPHYAYKDEEKRFVSVFDKPFVMVDTNVMPSLCFKDNWDYSESFTNRFINTLFHMDVLVNTGSTLSLDATVFDKPLVSIAFDGYKKPPFHESVLLWYGTEHAKELVNTGALKMVYSATELEAAINGYLQDKTLLSSGRSALKKRLCDTIDGKRGKNLAEKIIQLVQ